MGVTLRRLGIVTAITLVALVVFGLLFRSTLYWAIPVAPGEPAGGGEIIEAVIFFGILGLGVLSMVMGVLLLVLPPRENIYLSVKILIVSVISLPAYYILHSFVPRLVH